MAYGAHAKGDKPRLLSSVLNLIFVVAMVIVLTFCMRTFVFQAYQIPSGSMEDTIQVGDMVFSEKITYYTRDAQRGDIITFEDPETPSRVLIKRVIATEGETVTLEGGKVCINGTPLNESYTNGLPSNPLNSNITYPYTVPADCLWVMGDNRTNSSDSRFFGAIKESSVTGKALMVYWPLQDIGILG